MLIRLLSLMALVAGPSFTQRSDTVSQRVFNNSLSAASSALIRNIGQSQHLFLVVASDSGGTCTLGAVGFDFFLEGSLDGTTYIPISTRTIVMSTGATASTRQGFGFANGAFPFLRARYTGHPTNCRIDAWYSGTIPTAAFPQLPKSMSTGYLTAGTGLATAGSAVLIANTSSTARIVVYGLFLFNAADTGNDVAIEARDVACSPSVFGSVIDLTGLPGRSQVTWPTSIVPYFMGPEGQSLCLTIGSSSLVQARIVYRME